MDIAEIELTIRTAMANCHERGIKIMPNGWGIIRTTNEYQQQQQQQEWQIYGATICPLAAVVICGEENMRKRATAVSREPIAAALALNVSEEWVVDFVAGVDGRKTYDSEAYQLGGKFRYELLWGKEEK